MSDSVSRLAFTYLVDDDRSPNPRIQLHCVHLSGVPQNISLWECSMEPVSRRSGFALPGNAAHAAFTGLFCIRGL
jgi:hypothetical protein